jgi:hypothetical protein
MIEPTPARHETVILWHGDDYQPLAEKFKAVESAATNAVVSGPARIGDDSSTRDAVEDWEAFRKEALERATKVDVRALGRKEWRDLLAQHPVRKITETAADGTQREVTHPDDAELGWNSETLPDPLVKAALKRDPYDEREEQFASDAKRDAWLDSLSDPEFSLLYSAAVRLNISGGPDPKAQLSLLLDLTSTETSTSPERLG